MTGSFGRPGPVDDGLRMPAEESPTPVLHVGEVHAELRLNITDETLHHLGSQIASAIASAVYQGFEAGLDAAGKLLDERVPETPSGDLPPPS